MFHRAKFTKGGSIKPSVSSFFGLEGDHVRRYLWVSDFARDKSVIDVSCGRGYGIVITLRCHCKSNGLGPFALYNTAMLDKADYLDERYTNGFEDFDLRNSLSFFHCKTTYFLHLISPALSKAANTWQGSLSNGDDKMDTMHERIRSF
jgi:hypothetical protein